MKKIYFYPRPEKILQKNQVLPVKNDAKPQINFSNVKNIKKLNFYSYLQIYAKFLFSHLFATIVSLVLSWMQKLIDNFCFMSPVCICNNNFSIKLYSTIRLYFLQWGITIFLIGNFIFIIKGFNTKKIKIMFYLASLLFINGYYMMRDGDNPSENETFINTFLISLVFIPFLFLLIKQKFSFKKVIPQFFNQLGLTFLQYIDFLFCSFILFGLQSYFEFAFGNEGKSVYQLFLTVYYQIWFSFTKIVVLKFGQFALKQGLTKFYFFQYARLFLMKIFALNLINAIRNPLSNWNIWILYFLHAFFLLRIYLKYDPLEKIYNKVRQKLIKDDKKKSLKMSFSVIEREKKVENKLGVYVFDIQHIVIMRLFVLWLTNQWFGFNRIEFYQNCSFDKNSKFYIDLYSLVVFSMINIVISLIHVLIMNKKKKTFIKKEVLLFKNWIFIICFYSYLEVQIQEYYGTLISK